MGRAEMMGDATLAGTRLISKVREDERAEQGLRMIERLIER
jgi:hypothetical protein